VLHGVDDRLGDHGFDIFNPVRRKTDHRGKGRRTCPGYALVPELAGHGYFYGFIFQFSSHLKSFPPKWLPMLYNRAPNGWSILIKGPVGCQQEKPAALDR
jgi:hypothetical protein